MKKLSATQLKTLTGFAMQARNNAYCPYSDHPVGAALVTVSGKVYVGANCEFANYDCTCAESSAISAMITAGERSITHVVVVGPAAQYLCTPCGRCRQRLREFSGSDMLIYAMWKDGSLGKVFTLSQLLPHSFGPDNVGEVGHGPKAGRKKVRNKK